jgi:hypothetical protein
MYCYLFAISCLVGHSYELRRQFKALLYMLTAAASWDEETQRNGFVTVSYYVDYTKRKDASDTTSIKSFLVGLSQLAGIVPLRRGAGHFCHTSDTMRAIYAIGMMVIPSKIRTRMRAHHGKFLSLCGGICIMMFFCGIAKSMAVFLT